MKSPTEAGLGSLASEVDVARRLLRDHVRPHAGKIALAAIFMVLAAASTAAAAYLIGPVVEQIFQVKDPRLVTLFPLLVLAVLLVQAGTTYAQAILMASVGQRIIADIQGALVANLVRADLARLNKTHSGSFISSFLYDANLMLAAVAQGVTGLAKDFTTLLLLIAVMIYSDWALALIAVAVLPFAAYVTRKLGRHMKLAAQEGMDETQTLTRLISEMLKGARTVKAYRQEDRETERARASIEARLDHILGMTRARVRAAPLTEALTAFGVAGVVAFAGYRSLSNAIDLKSFMSFLAAALLAYQPARSLSQLHVAVIEGLTAARRIFQLLDVAPTIADRPDAVAAPIVTGEIRLADVHFAYLDGTAALNGVTLAIPAGRTVALVGPSGAGKSTVFNLIPRFYDVSSGRIEIDGLDIRDRTIAALRSAIAVVTQEPFLFDESVRANISYGRPGAGDEDVERAARSAAAHNFIVELPQGYDTRVGEQGVRLSGGQRQRIAIARAMLADAPILLLDEATSSLDSESERQVQTALHNLMAGRTTLVIAHRLSTVMDADEIFVLDGGRVVEHGTHGELLSRGGLYARLYRTQFIRPVDHDRQAAPIVAGE